MAKVMAFQPMKATQSALPVAARWLCGCAGAGLLAGPVQAQSEDDSWTRHFRLGMQIGLNLKADFSMHGQFGLSGSQPGPAGVSGVNHSYDDGYVLVDRTGNAAGFTSNWGYTSASQYNPATQTLVFHSATSFDYRGSDSSNGQGVQYMGLDLAYGGEVTRWGPVRIGWEFGFGLLPIGITDSRPLPAEFSQAAYSFSTAGIVLPTAPYNGGPSGLGPTIHDVATALPANPIGGTLTGTRTLDADLFSFRLGPTVYWPLSKRWAVEASGGFAMGVVSADYKFNETAVFSDGGQATNHGDIGATDLVYGGYVAATIKYHPASNWDIYVGAQFMPLGDALVSGGGRQARLDLSTGAYLSAGINWPF